MPGTEVQARRRTRASCKSVPSDRGRQASLLNSFGAGCLMSQRTCLQSGRDQRRQKGGARLQQDATSSAATSAPGCCRSVSGLELCCDGSARASTIPPCGGDSDRSCAPLSLRLCATRRDITLHTKASVANCCCCQRGPPAG